MSTILVFVEQTDGTPRRAALECLGAATTLDGEITAVVAGPGASDAAAKLGNHGAAKAIAVRASKIQAAIAAPL